MACAGSGMALWAVLAFASPGFVDEADDQYQFLVGLCDKQMFELAVKEGEGFLRDHAGHPKEDLARYRLASALFEIGRKTDAAKHYEKLSARRDFEYAPESAFRLAQCRLESKDLDGAKKALDVVMRASAAKDYLVAPAAFLLGEVAFQQNDFVTAEASYTKALEKEPDGANAKSARYGVAWSRFRNQDFSGAIAAIGAFLKKHGDDELAGEMRFLLGESHLEAGKPADAITAYATVKNGPFADAALRGLGFARLAAKDEAGAAKEFAALVERHPDSRFAPEAAIQCASLRLKSGDAKGALDILRSKNVSDSAEALLWRARAESKLGEKKAALATVDSALSKRPGKDVLEPLQILRGDLLADLGDVGKAGEAYAASASDYALHAAAVTKLNAGDLDGAAQLAKSLLDRFPDSEYRAHASLVLGERALARKDFERADESFAAATKSKDAGVALRAASRLAWCAFLAGDAKTAAKRFSALVDREGAEREEALYMLARSEDAASRPERAIEAYRRVVAEFENGKHHADALLGLIRLGTGDEALRAADLALAAKEPPAALSDALLGLAERLRAAGDVKNADRVLERVADSGAKSPPAARYALAYSRYEAGDAERCAKLLEGLADSRDLDPKLRAAVLELDAYARLKLGDAVGAAVRVRALSDSDIDAAKRLELTRLVARELGKTDAAAAEQLFAELERGKKGGSDPSLAAQIAAERVYLALDRKDVKGAVALVESVDPKIRGAIDEASFFVGEALFDAGNFEGAAPMYARAVHAKKFADKALYKSGFAALRRDDAKAAERAFATLVAEHAKSPLFGESLYLLGESRFRLGEFDAAIEPLAKLRKDQPQHATMPKALFRLGVALGKLQRFEDSELVLTDLARRFPEFPNLAEAELWRGRAFLARGNARAAKQALEKTIGLDKGELAARARIELGRMHAMANEHEKALAEFLKVAVLYGGEDIVAESLLHAGESLESLGDKGKAQAQYEELVAKYPRSPHALEAKNRIARIRTL